MNLSSRSSTHSSVCGRVGIRAMGEKGRRDARMPRPWFITSITASVALRTLGKWTAATVVGRTGASLIVTLSWYGN